jgi:predicted MFS family arabinose efflux permease
MANNLGRMIGPALAGFLIAAFSIEAAYAVGLLVVGIAWFCIQRSEPAPAAPGHPAGRFTAAMLDGVRYCLTTEAYRAVLARVGVFFGCAVSIHSLLPVLMSDAHWFGLAWAAYGAGAIVTAALFPSLVARLDTRSQLTVGILAHAALLLVFAWLPADELRVAAMVPLGGSWYMVISGAQLAVQRVTPDRFRARSLGFLTMVLMGGFGAGAACWGALARALGPSASLTVAGLVSLVALAATWSAIPRGSDRIGLAR